MLVTYPGKEEEAVIRLARVGYDNAVGYLEGGFSAWQNAGKETETINRITAEEFARLYTTGKPVVIDVRKKSEFDSQHAVDALNIPLNQINSHLQQFPKNKPFILNCAGGYRSMIAASLLKQRGFDNFVDVVGGFTEIAKTDVPKTSYVCPSTLL